MLAEEPLEMIEGDCIFHFVAFFVLETNAGMMSGCSINRSSRGSFAPFFCTSRPPAVKTTTG